MIARLRALLKYTWGLLLVGCATQVVPTLQMPSGTPTHTALDRSTPTAAPSVVMAIPTSATAVSRGVMRMISIGLNNVASNDSSEAPSISGDGRFIAFVSFANNLVSGDTSKCSTICGQVRSCANVFVYDNETRGLKRVSISNNGMPGNRDSGVVEEAGTQVAISSDGRLIVFHSAASNLITGSVRNIQIYAYNQQSRKVELISLNNNNIPGNGDSLWPAVSAEARYIAFISSADNLVSSDKNNACGPELKSNCPDVFVRDRQSEKTELVSIASDGTQGNGESGHWYVPSISLDGRYVAFWSSASNLVADDTNGAADIFVHDRQTGKTQRVSVESDGAQGNGRSCCPSISSDGRYIAFVSAASNFTTAKTNNIENIYVHDRATGNTELVSMTNDGSPDNKPSVSPSISANGRFIAFASLASNLIPGDTNGRWGIFVYDRGEKR